MNTYILFKEFPQKVETDLEVKFLQPGELRIVENLIPGLDFWAMARAIFAGERGYSLRIGTEIAAFLWISHKSASYKHTKFSLKDNEGFLYNQFTLEEYRGKGYAEILRKRVYELTGKDYYYSFTDCENKQALRMKEKLGAVKVKKIIELFGRPFTIKRYEEADC